MNLKLISALAILAVSAVAPVGATQMLVDVQLNTTSLASSAAGPFQLDVQLNDGGDPNNNTASLFNFSFGGGGPLGIPSLTGGASGSLSSSIMLADTNFLNEFRQSFNAGSVLKFTMALATNVDPSGTPDQFSLAILDFNGNELPTSSVGTDGTSVILLADLVGGTTQLSGFGSDPNAAIAFAAPSVASSVPEPATIGMAAAGLALFVLRRLRHS